MDLLSRPLRQVREIDNTFITLADGCKLAARIWLPEDAEQRPVPAVLEYIPYRKRDSTAPRDESMHPLVAAHGYACVRVDMRGNGESDGLMQDEYLPQELSDGVEVIAWLAGQPWCSGSVGMLGISWGGFNGLQIAALRPPALKAVITLCSTDDRYADDIHYRGGCLLNDNLAWSATVMAYSSRSPDPAIVGDRWRAMWLERLENMPFLAANWLEHQRRDAFWKHGSICENFADVEVPVLAAGGWADSYSNAVPRLVAGLSSPAAGLIGPWGHKYPQLGVPGPAMDFVSEMVRWWDRWLYQRPAQDLPALRAYIMDGPDAGLGPDFRRGFWISEPAWPSPNVESLPLHLGHAGALSENSGAAAAPTVASPLTTGLAGGRFYPKHGRLDLAVDQRADDAGSLVFNGVPLTQPIDLLGAPVAELEVSSDRPQANLAVRLCHVGPDGASHRISIGVLNLTHRDSHEEPSALEPGRRYRVRIVLDDIGYRVPAGHRLRVSVSTAYWPMIWPSPEPVMLTLHAPASRMLLPVRQGADQHAVDIEPTEAAVLGGFRLLRPSRTVRRVCHDAVTGETVVEHADDTGLKCFDSHGLETALCGTETYGIGRSDPLTAWARTHWTVEVGRGAWRTRTESTSAMRADATTFHIEAELVAFEGDHEVFRRRWERSIPRDHV